MKHPVISAYIVWGGGPLGFSFKGSLQYKFAPLRVSASINPFVSFKTAQDIIFLLQYLI